LSFFPTSKAHTTVHFGGALAAFAVLMAMGPLAGAHGSADFELRQRARALAEETHGRLDDAALALTLDESDPAAARLIERFEDKTPEARPLYATQLATDRHALRALSFDGAKLVNSSLTYAGKDATPAEPFHLTGSAADQARALNCLTEAVYYEAALEPSEGQEAVAQVVLNRVRHPIFPKSVCGVVYQGAQLKTGCQFSFACDGSMARGHIPWAWNRARKVAEAALNGHVMAKVGQATHYHTDYVVPWWAPTVHKVAKVGTHIFYRWAGEAGLPAAFDGRYAGVERVSAPSLQQAALRLAARDGRSAAALPSTIEVRSDGRVHAVIPAAAPAEPEPMTPRQRYLALARKGALGAGFDPSALAKPAAAAPVAIASAATPEG
jgi:spore germination cell wall hydrolase CwlJ-like protein